MKKYPVARPPGTFQDDLGSALAQKAVREYYQLLLQGEAGPAA